MLPAGLKIGASEKRRKQKKLKRANRIEYCNSFAVSMKTVWNYFKFDCIFSQTAIETCWDLATVRPLKSILRSDFQSLDFYTV